MESLTDFEEEFLTCKICLETFKEPKTLPCLHTFCLRCLRSYIQTTQTFLNRTAFRCPTCRDLTHVAEPAGSDWASQFKTNFYVNSLLDAAAKSPTRTVSATAVPQSSENEAMCLTHVDNILNLFCVDCNKAVCIQCSVISHRGCRQVIPIEKIANTRRSEMEAIRDQTDDHIRKFTHVLREMEKERHNVKESKTVTEQAILKQSAAAIMAIKTATTKCLDNIEAISKDVDAAMSKEYLNNEKMLQYLKSFYEEVQFKIEGPDSKIFDGLKWITDRRTQLLMHIPDEFSIPAFKYIFESRFPNAIDMGDVRVEGGRIPLLFRNDKKSGENRRQRTGSLGIERVSISETESSPFMDECKSLTLVSMMDTKMKSDKSTPCMRDIAVLPSKTVVVTDFANNCVKSFPEHATPKDKNCGRYSTGMPPHAIAMLSSTNQVAVTVPKAKQILILNVTPVFVSEKQISVSKKYWGVANVGIGVLAVSTCPGSEPGVIDLINLEGVHIKTVVSQGMFSNPLYLSVSTTMNILVSDCTIHKVAALRQNGDILFGRERMPKVMTRPMGITCDHYDAILIADGAKAIAVMDENGELKRSFNLDSKHTKKDTFRSVAVYDKNVYIATENSHLFLYHLD